MTLDPKQMKSPTSDLDTVEKVQQRINQVTADQYMPQYLKNAVLQYLNQLLTKLEAASGGN